jgi:ABC-type sugar transport system substrate-binding protein
VEEVGSVRFLKPAAALVVTVLSVAAAGCATSPSSSAGGTPATSSSSATQGKLKSIFFANPLPAYPDWGTANSCFYAEVKKFGLTGVSQGPTGLQINDQFVLDSISQALAEHYSAMIVVPITPSEYQPIMQRARAQGMLVATLNTGSSTTAQNFEIGTSYPALGLEVAKNIGARGGQQYLGLVTNGPGGIGATIFSSLEANLPANVHVVATAYDNGDPGKTEDAVAQMLIAHPNINVIYAWEGTAVAGISAAIKQQNRVGKTAGVVNDLTPQVIAGIKDGTIYGTNRQHFCLMAQDAVKYFVAISRGQKVPALTDTGTTFVTKANLQQVLAEVAAGQ